MATLVYEFSRVEDRDGNSIINNEQHANPVFIVIAKKNRSAILSYVDKPELALITSKVEEVHVLHNYIKIITENTEYTLQPYLREVGRYE